MRAIIATALGAAITLGGCAVQRANLAERAQSEMVGMSKKELLLCAGVPLRQERVEDLEFLTFSGGGDSVSSGAATAVSSKTVVGTETTTRRYCEATFVLKNSAIEKVSYQGRTGGLLTKGEQCAFIVENCLKR
ncbi:MAG: hypothetical protein ACOY7P_03900 [Pseudomonadota bacterium]